MKPAIPAIFFILSIIITNCGRGPESLTFYVSPEGDDAWSGILADPNNSDDDGPFKTPERARSAVRTALMDGLSSGSVTVSIRAGVYSFDSSFTLEAADGGMDGAPIVWRAHPGEDVRFIGGRTVAGFAPIPDGHMLDRLAPDARDKVLVTDLASQGIDDYGTIATDGWHSGRLGMELFYRGEPMTIARYPNEDWLTIADVPQTGPMQNPGLDRDTSTIPRGRHFGRFTYPGDRPASWEQSDDIWMHGYYVWDWADEYNRVASFVTAKHEVYPAEPYHNYGYQKGQRFYFLNVFEELDAPGEYYIDRTRKKLYFLPPSPISNSEVMVSTLDEPIVTVDNASHIVIRGITFECSRGNAVKVTGGTGILIAGCIIRNIGNDGVVFEGGTENGIQSCDLYNVEGGIMLGGGERESLTPGHNFAVNNHIHHYSRINRTYRVAATMGGVGNRFAHNLIHDAPHAGVLFWGNDHILEYNEIHNIALETGDVGGFYIGRDWTMRGNIVRYNYFHELSGPGLHGVMAVYLDDWASGTTIYGNVFRRAGRAAFVGGGRNNIIDNNIFVECMPSTHLDARGLGWAKNYFDGRTNTLTDRLDAMNYRKPPYSERYPELLPLYDDDPAVPKYNRYTRNISWGGRFIDLYDGMDFDIATVENNIIADKEIVNWLRPGEKQFKTFGRDAPEIAEMLSKNILYDSNPFLDPEHNDYTLRSDVQSGRIGFEPIPFDSIGLNIDEYRTSLPR